MTTSIKAKLNKLESWANEYLYVRVSALEDALWYIFVVLLHFKIIFVNKLTNISTNHNILWMYRICRNVYFFRDSQCTCTLLRSWTHVVRFLAHSLSQVQWTARHCPEQLFHSSWEIWWDIIRSYWLSDLLLVAFQVISAVLFFLKGTTC